MSRDFACLLRFIAVALVIGAGIAADCAVYGTTTGMFAAAVFLTLWSLEA